MKFSVKLALFFSCLFLAVSGIVVLSLSHFSHDIIKEEIGDNLEEQSLQSMDKLDRMLSNHLTHLLRLRDIVQENLLDAENKIDKEGIAKRFGSFMKRNPDFLSMSLHDMDRVRLVDTLGADIGKQHGLNEYWPEIIAGKDIVFDMYHSESAKRPVFHFAFPVKDKSGRPVAVFVVRIPPEDIDDIIVKAGGSHPDERAMVLSGQMKVDLVRKDGVLVYSNYNRAGILKDIAPQWERVREELEKGNLWDSYENNSSASGGELVVFAREKGYRNFAGDGWTLIVRIPSSFVFAPAASLTNKLLIILLVNGVICLIGVFLFSRTISKPIEKLDLAVAQIGKGNLDTVVDVTTNDEIGHLAKHFNKMSRQLANSTNVIKEQSERQKELTDEMSAILKTAEVGISHMVNRRAVWVNPQMERTYGYSSEEFINAENISMIYPSMEDYEAVGRDMAPVIASGGIYQRELQMKRKDGTLIWCRIVGKVVDSSDMSKGSIWVGEDITGRKLTEAALLESEERYRSLIESAIDPIYVHDFDGRFISVNQALLDIGGFTLDEVIGKHISVVVLPEYLEMAREKTMKKLRGEAAVTMYELEIIGKNGRRIPMEVNSTIIRKGGKAVAVLGVGRDLTERKRAEEALKRAEEKFRAYTENISDSISVVGADHKLTYVSPSIMGIIGYTPEETMEKDVPNYIHPDDLPIIAGAMARVLEHPGSTDTVQYRMIHKNGSYVHVETTGVSMMDNPAVQGVVLAIRNITERKRADEERQEFLNRLNKIASLAPGAIYQFRLRPDGSSCFPYASEAFRDIYRIGPEEVREDASKVFALMHPDDYDGVFASIHESALDLTPWRHEARLVFDDGEILWAFGNAIPQREADGSTLWHGFITDVTERKKAETERKKAEEYLRERMRHAEFLAQVGIALTEGGSIREALGKCCQSMVDNLEAVFARVWTFNEAENMLELQASAGMYTHIDGGHSRVPVGKFKIGLIAQERKPHLTNQVVGDPRVGEQEWAKREGMAAFAGYPLVVDDKLIGVMAMFSRKPLSEMTLHMLGTAAYEIALGVKHRTDVEVIKESRAMAESATKLKDKFVALVAHDMRSPLTGVHGLLKHVLDRDESALPDYATKSISRAVQSCEKMIKLSEGLLDLEMYRTGKIEPACEVVDAWPCVIEAIAGIEHQFSGKGVSLLNRVPEQSFQFADPKLLTRVIQNMLTNALKFSKSGATVTVFIPEGSPSTIAVEDTGVGIRAEKIANLFEYTGSVSTTGTGGERGTGMGLPMSYEIVKAMGGNLRVESQEGKGSVFYIDLKSINTASATLLA
jgi:PAS domain S-box-containing protein